MVENFRYGSSETQERKHEDSNKPIIKFKGDSLFVAFKFSHIVTIEDVERSHRCRLAYTRANGGTRLTEIPAIAQEGDVREEIIYFEVARGKNLYGGLPRIHEENPSVLSELVTDLINFRQKNILDRQQALLIFKAVEGLKRIIQDPRKELEKNR